MIRARSIIASFAPAAAALVATACGNPNMDAMEPYDLPVKVEGGIEETEAVKSTPLTITVESVEAEEDPEGEATASSEDIRGAVESAVAFDHYADIKSCESTMEGWESSFESGTIVIAFTLLPGGATQDVTAALTTGSPADAFTNCLVGVVSTMILGLEGSSVEEPTPFHLILRYGK